MKSTEIIIRKTIYSSEVRPDVTTEDPEMVKVVEWADANPTAWSIVAGTKSVPFGRKSSVYVGCKRDILPLSVLDRVATFKKEIEDYEERVERLRTWRARFTLEHYEDNGFKGGLFQQFDGKYLRGCAALDYTPETVDEVIDRFIEWCGSTYQTHDVWIDRKVVRRVAQATGT
jgi:hypothetical protein